MKRKLTPAVIALAVIVLLLAVLAFGAGHVHVAVLLICAGITVYGLLERYRLRLLMREARLATAKIVDYHVKTVKVHHRYRPNEKYPVYAPVVCFDTEDGAVITVDYPIFSKEQWYSYEKEYPIRYSPHDPEVFCFVGREDELESTAWSAVQIGIISAAVYGITLLLSSI